MLAKAMLFRGPDNPYEWGEIEVPEPKEGETIVKVISCSLCGTDVHYMEGSVPLLAITQGKTAYRVLGHEIFGIDLKTDKKVLVPAVLNCRSCRHCLTGRSNICLEKLMLGNDINGGFAEFVHIPRADSLCVVPDDIFSRLNCPEEYLCVIADAMTTAYHAVFNRAQIRGWRQKVVVIGCGGVGINVIQMAAAAGALVVGLDLDQDKAKRVERFGAEAGLCIPKEGDSKTIFKEIRQKVRDVLGGDPGFCFEVVGHPDAFELAFRLLDEGGTLVNVGYTSQKSSVATGNIMYKELTILGSYGCPPEDYPKVLSMVLAGRVKLGELVTGEYNLADLEKAVQIQGDPATIRSIIKP